MNRNARNVLHQRRTAIARRSQATQTVEFFNVLTSPELLQTTEALLPKHRERLYPPTPLGRETGRLLREKALAQWLWRGRTVKLVDGLSV